MNMQPIQKVLSLAAAISFLSACGGSGQDKGTAAPSVTAKAQTIAGVAIDGHLARATVYIDTDNNGTRDAWEPFAFTDNDGYYSLNKKTNKDYCASTATKEEAQYCLRATRNYENVVVRIDRGYDILTGEPFEGQLSVRVKTIAEGTTDLKVVSPITTLLTSVPEADTPKVLSALGLKADDLTRDYIDDPSGVNNKVLNVALKLHKSVTLLSDKVVDNYSALGSESGTPNDATHKIYEHLANEIKNSSKPLDDVLANPETLKRVAEKTEEDVKKIYTEKKLTLPENTGDTKKFDRAVEVAANIPAVTNELIPDNKNFSLEQTKASAKALEVVVIKGVKEDKPDASLDNAVKLIKEAAPEVKQNLVNSLMSDTADVSQLASNSFETKNFETPEKANAAARLPKEAVPFTSVGGYQIRVSDSYLGVAPNKLQDIEFELYFAGTPQDLSGSFSACGKFIKKAKSDGTLGKGDTRGELVTGTWSVLGGGNANASYSLLLTFDFLGAKYQAIMKHVGKAQIKDKTMQQLLFDNNDTYRIWDSEFGLQPTNGTPANSDACKARLPSRIGI